MKNSFPLRCFATFILVYTMEVASQSCVPNETVEHLRNPCHGHRRTRIQSLSWQQILPRLRIAGEVLSLKTEILTEFFVQRLGHSQFIQSNVSTTSGYVQLQGTSLLAWINRNLQTYYTRLQIMKAEETRIQNNLASSSLVRRIRHMQTTMRTALCLVQRSLISNGIEADDIGDIIANAECPSSTLLRYSANSLRHLRTMKTFFDVLKDL